MTMRRFRIIWTSKATGTDQTTVICNTECEARCAARKMIGEPIFFDDEQIGVVENAYLADENGNPL